MAFGILGTDVIGMPPSHHHVTLPYSHLPCSTSLLSPSIISPFSPPYFHRRPLLTPLLPPLLPFPSPSPSPSPHMILIGDDLGVNATSSALACAQQCDVIPSCVAWAWDSCGGMKRRREGERRGEERRERREEEKRRERGGEERINLVYEGVTCWLKKNMAYLTPSTCRTSSARSGVIGVDRSGQDMPGNRRGEERRK